MKQLFSESAQLPAKYSYTQNILQEVSETVLKENKLSRRLVDLLIDKVSVYPGGKVTVDWKVAGFESIIER